MASTAVGSVSTPMEQAPTGFTLTDLALLGMALIWGLNFIVVKFATGVFAPLAFSSLRIGIAVVILWSIFAARRHPLPGTADLKTMLLLGVLGNGLYQVLWIEGMARTRASDAALLVAATPAFIEVIGWLRGHQRAGLRAMAGIVISLIGIGLVVSGGRHEGAGQSTLLGNALILSSVLCWAYFSVVLQPHTERIDGLTLSAVTMTGGLALMLVVSAPALANTKWSAVSNAGWAAVAYSSVLALVVAYLFWYRGVRVLGPTRTAMYSNLQPLVAMIAAWALLAERPRLTQIAGALCIIGGLLLTRMPGREPIVAHE